VGSFQKKQIFSRRGKEKENRRNILGKKRSTEDSSIRKAEKKKKRICCPPIFSLSSLVTHVPEGGERKKTTLDPIKESEGKEELKRFMLNMQKKSVLGKRKLITSPTRSRKGGDGPLSLRKDP